MPEAAQQISGYLPTALVTLFVGWLGYKNTRASRQDTTLLQQKANRMAETQQALDAQKSISDQWHEAFNDERKRRIEAERERDQAQRLVRHDFEESLRKFGITPD